MVRATDRASNAVCFLAGSAGHSRRHGILGAIPFTRLGEDAMDDGLDSGRRIRRSSEIRCAFS